MIRRLLFWALFPLAIPQALRLKRTAPRFPGAAGNDFGVIGNGKLCRLLAIGDSLVAGVGAETFDKALVGQTARAISTRFGVSVAWWACGQTGIRTENIRRTILPGIPDEPFDVILISAGVNDVTGLKRSASYERAMERGWHDLHQHSPNAQVVVAGLPPMNKFPLLPQPLRSLLGLRSRTFDDIVRNVAEQDWAIHVPVTIHPDPDKFAGDGYHPSESGYADFGDAISLRLDPVGTRSEESYSGTNVAPIR